MIIKSPQIPGLMYFLGYGVSLVAAFALTLTLIQIFSKLSILARPLNKLMISMGKPVIPLGGIPVTLSFLFVLWFFYFSGWINQENLHLFQKFTLGVILMTVLGIYDDIYQCPPRVKFIWQIIIAIILFLA